MDGWNPSKISTSRLKTRSSVIKWKLTEIIITILNLNLIAFFNKITKYKKTQDHAMQGRGQKSNENTQLIVLFIYIYILNIILSNPRNWQTISFGNQLKIYMKNNWLDYLFNTVYIKNRKDGVGYWIYVCTASQYHDNTDNCESTFV